MRFQVPGQRKLGNSALAVLALLCLAPFLAVLDTTIMTIALPSIRRDLDFSPATIQWVISSYSLSFGGLLLLGGRLGDVLGRKRVLAWGFVVLGVASLVGGFAPSPCGSSSPGPLKEQEPRRSSHVRCP